MTMRKCPCCGVWNTDEVVEYDTAAFDELQRNLKEKTPDGVTAALVHITKKGKLELFGYYV